MLTSEAERFKKEREKANVLAMGLAKLAKKHEQECLKLIDERDAAEQALSQAYYLVIGRSPEWSNLFGHAEALEEIGDAMSVLRQALKAAESKR